MQLFVKLKMIDRSDFTIAGVATFCGFVAQQALGAYLALPLSLQTLLQGLITIALGCCVVTTQHFLRRFLKRNWPEDGAPGMAGPGPTLADWFGLARRLFILFRANISPETVRRLVAFVRSVISRLRKGKES
jgi:hypothetical protein